MESALVNRPAVRAESIRIVRIRTRIRFSQDRKIPLFYRLNLSFTLRLEDPDLAATIITDRPQRRCLIFAAGMLMKRASAVPFLAMVLLCFVALFAKGWGTAGPKGGVSNPGDIAWMLTAAALGAADDAWAFVFLWRNGQLQECRFDDASEHDRAGGDQPGLGRGGVQSGVRRRYWRRDWKSR